MALRNQLNPDILLPEDYELFERISPDSDDYRVDNEARQAVVAMGQFHTEHPDAAECRYPPKEGA